MYIPFASTPWVNLRNQAKENELESTNYYKPVQLTNWAWMQLRNKARKQSSKLATVLMWRYWCKFPLNLKRKYHYDIIKYVKDTELHWSDLIEELQQQPSHLCRHQWLGFLLCWLEDLEGAHQILVNIHHCTGIIKFTTVVRSWKYSH